MHQHELRCSVGDLHLCVSNHWICHVFIYYSTIANRSAYLPDKMFLVQCVHCLEWFILHDTHNTHHWVSLVIADALYLWFNWWWCRSFGTYQEWLCTVRQVCHQIVSHPFIKSMYWPGWPFDPCCWDVWIRQRSECLCCQQHVWNVSNSTGANMSGSMHIEFIDTIPKVSRINDTLVFKIQ